MITKLSSKNVYHNKWVSVREDQVQFDNQSEGIYSVVDKPDFVLVIPFDGEFFYLVKQYRYPIQQYFIEFPSGSHEESNIEDELQLVKDELEEETGLKASKITKLTILHEEAAIINHRCYLFLAEDLTPGKQKLDSTEADLEVLKYTAAELESAILNHEVVDAKTLAAYLIWKLRETSRH